ncbi:hypothetical protein N431DRAFT_430002 [Stipitochalara longipes BDJ]|nr:hypothetical protein N431DRAFT_430002 [Stipitochalara longipes BDJ]
MNDYEATTKPPDVRVLSVGGFVLYFIALYHWLRELDSSTRGYFWWPEKVGWRGDM